jgi:hypothetical protein
MTIEDFISKYNIQKIKKLEQKPVNATEQTKKQLTERSVNTRNKNTI